MLKAVHRGQCADPKPLARLSDYTPQSRNALDVYNKAGLERSLLQVLQKISPPG